MRAVRKTATPSGKAYAAVQAAVARTTAAIMTAMSHLAKDLAAREFVARRTQRFMLRISPTMNVEIPREPA
jgi:hypothetical protein